MERLERMSNMESSRYLAEIKSKAAHIHTQYDILSDEEYDSLIDEIRTVVHYSRMSKRAKAMMKIVEEKFEKLSI
jgi:hypothetical protein